MSKLGQFTLFKCEPFLNGGNVLHAIAIFFHHTFIIDVLYESYTVMQHKYEEWGANRAQYTLFQRKNQEAHFKRSIYRSLWIKLHIINFLSLVPIFLSLLKEIYIQALLQSSEAQTNSKKEMLDETCYYHFCYCYSVLVNNTLWTLANVR